MRELDSLSPPNIPNSMPTRITENYNDFTKEELLAECQSRGIEGVDSHTLKADIIAALELNDEQNKESKTDEPAPNTLPPKPVESNIPHIGTPNVDNIPTVESGDVAPKNEDFTDGQFTMRPYVTRINAEGVERRETTLHPGEPFALCKHEPDTYGRTHSLKNSLHFWQGTEGAFQLYFEKE